MVPFGMCKNPYLYPHIKKICLISLSVIQVSCACAQEPERVKSADEVVFCSLRGCVGLF